MYAPVAYAFNVICSTWEKTTFAFPSHAEQRQQRRRRRSLHHPGGQKREKSQGNNRGTVVLSQPLIMRPGQVHGYLFSFLLRKLETSSPQIGSACRTKAAPSCRQGVSFSALSKKRMRHKGLLTILSETRFELAKGGASNPRFSRAFLFSFSSLACFLPVSNERGWCAEGKRCHVHWNKHTHKSRSCYYGVRQGVKRFILLPRRKERTLDLQLLGRSVCFAMFG